MPTDRAGLAVARCIVGGYLLAGARNYRRRRRRVNVQAVSRGEREIFQGARRALSIVLPHFALEIARAVDARSLPAVLSGQRGVVRWLSLRESYTPRGGENRRVSFPERIN